MKLGYGEEAPVPALPKPRGRPRKYPIPVPVDGGTTPTTARTKTPRVPQGFQWRHVQFHPAYPVKDLEPWDLNPPVREQMSDRRLETDIRAVGGVIKPLLAVRLTPHAKRLTVIDGNRRLRVARAVGLASVPVLFCEVSNVVAFVGIVNSGERSWHGREWSQLAAKRPEALPAIPPGLREKVRSAMDTLGDHYDEFVEQYSIDYVKTARDFAAYCKQAHDRRFVRRVTEWGATHRMSQALRVAIRLRMAVGPILAAITANQPYALPDELRQALAARQGGPS